MTYRCVPIYAVTDRWNKIIKKQKCSIQIELSKENKIKCGGLNESFVKKLKKVFFYDKDL